MRAEGSVDRVQRLVAGGGASILSVVYLLAAYPIQRQLFGI
jgi:hypothetical protein